MTRLADSAVETGAEGAAGAFGSGAATAVTGAGAASGPGRLRRRVSVVAQAWYPESEVDTVPSVAGFVESSFSPMAAAVADRCLRQCTPVTATAVIIVSASGDVATGRAVSAAVAAGTRIGPLLFFQAVPNAVAGYVASKWNLTGPVVCLGPAEPGLEAGLELAELLISDGEAEQALVIAVEQGETDSARAVLVKGEQP